MLMKEGEKEACTHRWRSHREAGGQARARNGEPGAGEGMIAIGPERARRLGNSVPRVCRGRQPFRGSSPLDSLSAPCKSAKVGLQSHRGVSPVPDPQPRPSRRSSCPAPGAEVRIPAPPGRFPRGALPQRLCNPAGARSFAQSPGFALDSSSDRPPVPAPALACSTAAGRPALGHRARPTPPLLRSASLRAAGSGGDWRAPGSGRLQGGSRCFAAAPPAPPDLKATAQAGLAGVRVSQRRESGRPLLPGTTCLWGHPVPTIPLGWAWKRTDCSNSHQ